MVGRSFCCAVSVHCTKSSTLRCGLTTADGGPVDPELRKLADALGCALLLPRITSTNVTDSASAPALGYIDVLRNAALGGGEGLLMLLGRLASESRHREVAMAPLVLWGHSRTGHFAATFAALHAQRTVAIVGYHSAAGGMAGHDLAVLSKIPTLILMAKADIPNADRPEFRWPPAETVRRSGRAVDAPWTFGIEPEAVHQNPNDLKKANVLVIPWILDHGRSSSTALSKRRRLACCHRWACVFRKHPDR